MTATLHDVSTWPLAVSLEMAHRCVTCPCCYAVVPAFYAVAHQHWHRACPEATPDAERPDPGDRTGPHLDGCPAAGVDSA